MTAAKVLTLSALVIGTCSAVIFYGPNTPWHEINGQEINSQAAKPTENTIKAETKADNIKTDSKTGDIEAGPASGPQGLGPTQLQTDERGPRFDVARVDKDGSAVIAGRAAPSAKIDLLRDGEVQDSTVADSTGQFVMMEPQLPPGDYKLTLRSTSPNGTVTQSASGVSVALSEPAALPERVASAHADIASAMQEATNAPAKSTGDQSQASLRGAALPRVFLPRVLRHPLHQRLQHRLHVATVPLPEKNLFSVSEPAMSLLRNRIVSRGDSLWLISRQAYGDGTNYAVIFNANRSKIRNPNRIYPGQTLVLPVKE